MVGVPMKSEKVKRFPDSDSEEKPGKIIEFANVNLHPGLKTAKYKSFFNLFSSHSTF